METRFALEQPVAARPDDGSDGRCLMGTIGSPSGQGCEVLDYSTPRGSGTVQRCFQVTDTPAPPPQPQAAQPTLAVSPARVTAGAQLTIDGAGFQQWSAGVQGITPTVLDAGLPADWRDFDSTLPGLGYSAADVDAVLITHHHRDPAQPVAQRPRRRVTSQLRCQPSRLSLVDHQHVERSQRVFR